MRYLPHTQGDIAKMLAVVGVDRLDALFSVVPPECRMDRPLRLPEPLTEWELCREVEALAAANAAGPDATVFLGAGSYEHFIPATIPYLLSRSEFLTAYTPYQPELSQGTLQALFEYQTLIARLTGMDVANASLYDGATALVEAVLMAVRVTRRERVAVSRAVHPAYRRVLRTYLEPAGCELVELPYAADGRTDLAALDGMDRLAAVAVQSPNFFGCVEDLVAAGGRARDRGAFFVATFTEALAYGLLKNPGNAGADIVCGEGQSLGIPQSFGGPCLGVFAARTQHVRSMPGRLIGKTVDRRGRTGYVLTLATREQHIRREKATSNICSNQSLCALAAAMYLATLGRTGMRQLAKLNYDKAEYLKAELRRTGHAIRFEAPTFNEFVVELRGDAEAAIHRLLDRRIVPGLSFGEDYPELANCRLLCVTETKTRRDLDSLVRGLQP
ncbi:MAG: aminomethyl-transferring glycine dehydrogenase subunit GcvPA [Deltaproteobacteria bacterium]|nr:aminomethyl-transferring glycine dehydrogenase subunit GcvPA [Deltaproteobacteria bacterium]